ncbi:diguanylate cyclase response regulator [Pseudoalteromonas phenolica]|uniref:diguanylate cyclase n=1 Tax=Pseudoalteromonas phenolica TaxID=161398 RepID=A0A4Q7IRI2_9GAMM|nr:response regulator [Pseudoalteromonas phenolica]RZQ54522.1 diguanylate cyclase response regulator [Pseudoalteromonas phenolica]
MTRRILIVEDTPTIARVQKHIAISAGYEADLATSLAETKAFLANNTYFCAIVDFILPDAPNGEAIHFTVNSDIPTIVMTGNLDNQTKETVEKYPIIDYVTKENKQAYQYLKKQLIRLPRNEFVKVLVVDDSKQTRNYVSSLLARHKYKVLEASDGLEALEVLKENPDISVIITDNEMPNMNGEDLCSEIRLQYSNDEKAIIGISSSNALHLSARFIKRGANDYLRKPFNAEEFYCRLSQNVDMLEYIATIKRQANSDYLTGLPNRRYFFEFTNKSLMRKAAREAKAGLAMIDVDHFKSINDNYGHDAGDDVLKALAQAFGAHFVGQLTARLGGEEFAIYFENDTPEESLKLLEKFRRYLDEHSAGLTEHNIHFTVSIGFCFTCSSNVDSLIKEADIKLYDAKQSGRNKIVCR